MASWLGDYHLHGQLPLAPNRVQRPCSDRDFGQQLYAFLASRDPSYPDAFMILLQTQAIALKAGEEEAAVEPSRTDGAEGCGMEVSNPCPGRFACCSDLAAFAVAATSKLEDVTAASRKLSAMSTLIRFGDASGQRLSEDLEHHGFYDLEVLMMAVGLAGCPLPAVVHAMMNDKGNPWLRWRFLVLADKILVKLC